VHLGFVLLSEAAKVVAEVEIPVRGGIHEVLSLVHVEACARLCLCVVECLGRHHLLVDLAHSSHGCLQADRKVPLLHLVLLDDARDGILPFDNKQLFELPELLLKAHVRKYHRPLLARKVEGLVEVHLALLHKVSDDAGGGAADARVAVDQHAAPTRALLDEGYGRRKVTNKGGARYVQYFDHLVFEILSFCHGEKLTYVWKERLNAVGNLQDV
jgi:hypothetical protein